MPEPALGFFPWEGWCGGRGLPIIFSDFKPCAGFLPRRVSFSESALTPDVPVFIIDDKETHSCFSLGSRAGCTLQEGLARSWWGAGGRGMGEAGWFELGALEGHGRLSVGYPMSRLPSFQVPSGGTLG